MNLEQFFSQIPKAALGFSGGVDSAYLLYAAVQYGAEVCPYYVKTAFQPQFEYKDAKTFAQSLGMDLKVIEFDILGERTVASNQENRCYFCKKALFTLLKRQAFEDGYSVILDGTNASDDPLDRPGMKALEELSVRSPLQECGLSKEEIRRLSKKEGLFTWNKPAYACLATRIPTGKEITKELLERIEQAESVLFSLGFLDFRVREFHGAAKIQLPKEQFLSAIEKREEILERLSPYFQSVLLDMKER